MALVGLPPPASAQTPGLEFNVTVLGQTNAVAGSPSDHFLTFSAPVEVPGVALAPGAYIFRFSAPMLMQVVSANRLTVYSTFFVTPIMRTEVTSDYALTLRKVQSDAPSRIVKLFLPETSTGYAFTYPKIEAAAGARQVAMK